MGSVAMKFPTKIVAFDPGKSIGVAMYLSYDNNETGTFTTRRLMWDAPVKFPEKFKHIVSELDILLEDTQIVVVEDYIIDPRYGVINAGKPVWASESLGAIALYAYTKGIPVIAQHPSVQANVTSRFAKKVSGFGFGEKISGKSKRIRTKHEDSAMKHLLYYMKKTAHPYVLRRLRSKDG